MPQNPFRQLPAIDKWLASETGAALTAEFSSREVTDVMREHLAKAREALAQGRTELPDLEGPQYAALMRIDLIKGRLPSLRRAINATGIIIHTNLGRAPLAEEAIEAMADVARGYCNLEFSLDTGKRGSRYQHVEALLQRLTGAEAAIVVNNCAAAVTLALDAIARDGEVLISRGELVEIGGSFRIPEVIAKSGARMVEVGTTNITRIEDYAAAISEHTRVLLSVHPSNYRIVGFSSKPACSELAQLAHRQNLVFMQDLGSGALLTVPAMAAAAEPTIQQSLSAGADLVTFSGDKMLGGPQAGIILGRAQLIGTIKQDPLLRALRIDKLSLAALAATLRLYLPPNDPLEKVPVLRMINDTKERVAGRARALAVQLKKIPGCDAVLADDVSYGGGGALPMAELPTKVVHMTVAGVSAAELAARLREASPPVIGRIVSNKLALDPRTVLPNETKDLLAAVRRAIE